MDHANSRWPHAATNNCYWPQAPACASEAWVGIGTYEIACTFGGMSFDDPVVDSAHMHM